MYPPPLSPFDSIEIERSGHGVRIRTRTVVEPDGPYLSGHFPGRPILPGVFLVDTLLRAVCAGVDGARLTVLRSARFTAPVLAPGEFTMRVEVTGDPATGPLTARARCHRGDGEPCARLEAQFDAGWSR